MIVKIFRGLLVAACALFAGPSFAATLISTASGNIDSTATWSTVDTTGTNAYLNSETANTSLTTSAVASSTFAPAAETVTAIGVKLASVAAAPSGTLTVKLANSTSPGSRECTQTVNVADLVSAAAATAEGGWVILTCSALPNGTDSYTVTANTSVASQVNLFSLATTNWSRMLVTSGTQTGGPAAGDKIIVSGQLTGAGTHNAYTVTIETTALVNYGNVANTLVDPSIAVGQWGTLAFASLASTAYASEFAGPMVIYNGGTYNVGTSGTPVPSTSSATLTLNSTTEGDTGINVRNGGTFNSAGSSGGRTVTKTLLTATATGGSTSTLAVANSTGWLAGDSIVIAGTQPTSADTTSKWDAATLTSNATGTSLPLTAAVTNTHTATALSYTSSSTGIAYSMNMYAAVILLNRNVVIQGSSATTNGYVYFQANAHGAIDWTQFSQMSGTPAGQRGLEVDVGPAGSFSLTNSSFTNSHGATIVLAPTNSTFGGTQGSYLTLQHNVMYNVASGPATSYGLGFLGQTFNPFWKIDDLTVIRAAYNTTSAKAVWMAAANGQFTNITVTGAGQGGVSALTVPGNYNSVGLIGGQVGNAWGPINLYANTGYPLAIGGTFTISGKISGLYIWHEMGRFIPQGNAGDLTFDPFYLYTSSFGIYMPSAGGARLTFRNGVIGWDANNTASFPVTNDSRSAVIFFDNMDLCPVGNIGGATFVACSDGPGTNRIISLQHDLAPGGGYIPSTAQVYLRNTSQLNGVTTSYPTQGGSESFYGPSAFVAQDCKLCFPVPHAAWVTGGFLSYDAAISHVSSYSLRMTPKVGTFSGYIAGTTLTITSAQSNDVRIVDALNSNGAGFLAGTNIVSGSYPTFTVSQSQTVGSAGAPVQFQMYYNPSATNTPLRMTSAPLGTGTKVAVVSGQAAQACAWIRPSISTDAAPPWGGSAVTYNGDAPRMIVRANPYMGVQSDTVIATSSPTAGAWSQLCGTLPAAPADGQFEVVVDADQTFTSNPGGSVNVTEWSCSNCGSANGSQFWWNGSPSSSMAPPSSGGSGGHIIGGFLLRRDLNPTSNDNEPMWLNKAA